jgi:hypothetical protein
MVSICGDGVETHEISGVYGISISTSISTDKSHSNLSAKIVSGNQPVS